MFNEIGFGIRAVLKRKFTTTGEGREGFLSLGRKSHLRVLRVFAVNFWFSLKQFFHAQTDQAKCFVAGIFALVEERCEQGCGFVTQPG